MPKTESNSAAEKEQPQRTQNVQYAQPFEDETIDLYELWITLWNKKWIVIGMTAMAALGSVVFALRLPQVYKAEALLLPPKAKNVQALNVQGVPGVHARERNKDVKLEVADIVFLSFKNNLSSRIVQKKFIKKYDLMELLSQGRTPETSDEDIYKGFAKMIKFEEETINQIVLNRFSLELNDPVLAAQWVNDYIKFVDTETIDILVVNIRNSVNSKIRKIEYIIDTKRQMAKERRENTIQQFVEAANIAAKLGVKDRVDVINVVQNNQFDSSTSSTPLYYRGFRALNAEISILKNRKSDDPFISGLLDLKEKLALLNSNKIDPIGMHAVSIDQAAYPPKNRIKPNRRLIVSLGTVVGLFLGIFLVFFVSFIQNQKETHSA
jgi:chain length determinant protein (polysaccharide antigen chain regulator)